MTSSNPSSQGFWSEALALEPDVLPPQQAAKRPHEPSSDDEQDPYAAVKRRYILSPDTSEDASPESRRVGVDGVGGPRDAPSSPLGDDARYATELTFLQSNLRAGPVDGAHAYLAGDEYRPTAFGDIGDYMRKKDVKVQAQNAQLARGATDAGIPQIFAGLKFYINGNTQPPMEVLRRLIVQRGGIVQAYLRTKSSVDYVIAPVLTIAKFRELGKGGRIRIVKEGFITQCAEEGRVVDWRKWRLKPGDEGGIAGFMGTQAAAAATSSELPQPLEKEEASPVDEPPTVTGSERTSIAPQAVRAAGQSLLRPVPTSQRRMQAGPAVHPQRTPGSPRPPVRLTSVPALIVHPQTSSPATPRSPGSAAREYAGHPIMLSSPDKTVAGTIEVEDGLEIDKGTGEITKAGSSSRPGKPAESALVADGAPASAAHAAQFNGVPHGNAPVDDSPADNAYANGTAEAAVVAPTEAENDPAAADPSAIVIAEIETTAAEPNPPEHAWSNYALHRSNPHAARLMQREGFRENQTAVQGTAFIDKFYQNSRLHHLSTWKAELKLLVAEARSLAGHVPRALAPDTAERVIVHVDFDAFFVSAGLSSRPHLRGKPVVVCHSSSGARDSTSEIASASYEARALGVKNGMSLGRARQLCGPDLETIPYDFETYKAHSLAFYAVLLAYADELEAVSVDEALIDLTGAVTACALAPDEAGANPDPAIAVADRIRADIRDKTGCNVSIGIAHNILLARLATRKAKPPNGAGVYRLVAADVPAFLADLDVKEFPSFGYSARRKLEDAFGATTCGALLSQPREALRRTLGPKTGDTLYGFLRGRDDRRLEPDKTRKSVSAEINYAIRFTSQTEADEYIANLAEEVGKRLRAIGATGRQVTLKIMVRSADAPLEPPKFLGHGRCDTHNRSGALAKHTADGGAIGAECLRLLKPMRLDPTELRGIGIQVTKLEFGADVEVKVGQPMLRFAKSGKGVVSPAKAQAGANETVPALVQAAPLAQAAPPPQAPLTHHPSSEIDPEFLSALPPELRAEVEADHRAARAAKRAERSGVDETAAASIGPTVAAAGAAPPAQLNPAAHITRQLRPKVKTQLRAGEIAELPLYSAWARADAGAADSGLKPATAARTSRSRQSTLEPFSRAGSRSRSRSASVAPVNVPDDDADADADIMVGKYTRAELRRLGIDPDVFAALPGDMQRTAVDEQRAQNARHAALFRPAHRASPSKRHGGGGGTAAQPPPVAASRPRLPSLFGQRDTSSVAAVLARWVASAPQPAEPDVRRAASYLAKAATASIGGIDHVTTLLRGMRVLVVPRSIDQAWRDAFETLKAAVDDVMRARFGAPLRL